MLRPTMPFEVLLVSERLRAGAGCAFEWRIVFLAMFVEEMGLLKRLPAFSTAMSIIIVRRLRARIEVRHLGERIGRLNKAIVNR